MEFFQKWSREALALGTGLYGVLTDTKTLVAITVVYYLVKLYYLIRNKGEK